MGVNAGINFRIECSLPPLPTLNLFFPPIFSLTLPWPIDLSFFLSLTIKCPELPLDKLNALNEALQFSLPIPPIPPIDLSVYSRAASKQSGASAVFDSGKSPHWDTWSW